MVKISIACLIFKSVRWLKFVNEQVKKYTDLSDKEFYFVANDANDSVLNYLKNNNIPHYIHNNTEEQRKDWYINNVYRAWNTAIKVAKGDYIVLINSDMAFTEGWLDNLLNKVNDTRIVNSRLVERGVLRSGMYGIEHNFGNNPNDYDEDAFNFYANNIKSRKILEGGLFMPFIIKKELLERVNNYPEGNITLDSDIFNPTYAKKGEPCIPGDQVLIRKLNTINVFHYTAFDSIVYHFQEGESRDVETRDVE